jgi:hypothetical protein
MGRRGFAVVTDAPAIVAWAAGLIARDLDPGWHGDVRPYQRRDPSRGAPAADFKPAAPSAPGTYVPAGDAGLSLDAAIAIEAESAPENALSLVSGILGHLARVGNGGEVLVEQLREPLWWGDVADPAAESIRLNPRVAAYVAAARRGARVRVLLDSGLDDPTARGANHRTAAFLSALARRERLDLRCRLGNPTGAGIHAKVVLGTESAAGPRWVNLGSVNGTEVSSKANREVALTVTSDDLYAAIAAVFARDWEVSGFGRAYLPMAVR